MLSTELGAARDGLARLGGNGWLMSLPQQHGGHGGHPAGSALPGCPGSRGEPCLVAVTFGQPVATAGSRLVLPVQWEQVNPGDEFTVLLDGDVTLASADGQASRMLTLAGFCRVPGAMAAADDFELSRVQLAEGACAFITEVAGTVVPMPTPGQQRESLGPAWSWLNGLPRV